MEALVLQQGYVPMAVLMSPSLLSRLQIPEDSMTTSFVSLVSGTLSGSTSDFKSHVCNPS